jgi:ABC-2 type transport system ATP-binding protein
MLQIKNLSKEYGSSTILDDINLEISSGQTYTLLGKNGAGKTTMINLILDLIKPFKGAVSLDDKNVTELSAIDKKNIGVVAEDLGLIEEISGFEYLNFIGKIYKLAKPVLRRRIEDLFAYFFEDETDLNKSIANYSTGMKKKIAFCGAVLHTPKYLILDEPFSGLDPLVANQMISFLKKYQGDDRIIFISSHDLGYVQKVASHIGVLNDSKLVYNNSLQEFTENGANALDSALLKILKPNESELDKIDWL